MQAALSAETDDGGMVLKNVRRNTFRIIGGRWRGRRLFFPDNTKIRPSPDRVRETLFNWLRWEIAGARCLDLFAGSGALGLEALSQGAAAVDFVDHERRAIDAIRTHMKVLDSDRGHTYIQDALAFLASSSTVYDIIFVDPPFDAGLVAGVLDALAKGGRIRSGGWVYVEQAARDAQPASPDGWSLHRSRQAGEVGYHLYRCESGAAP